MMAKAKMKNKGLGDTWRTPPEVISFIENKFGKIQIDLCSSSDNKVCDINLDEDDDFLSDYWLDNALHGKGNLAWCNPPYSNPLPFIKQCAKWGASGQSVAGILNFDPSTKWFTELVNNNALIMPIVGGRISFLNESGIATKGNNKPQFMFYLAPFLAQKVDTEYINKSEIYGDK